MNNKLKSRGHPKKLSFSNAKHDSDFGNTVPTQILNGISQNSTIIQGVNPQTVCHSKKPSSNESAPLNLSEMGLNLNRFKASSDSEEDKDCVKPILHKLLHTENAPSDE